jgi:hypothetical protein
MVDAGAVVKLAIACHGCTSRILISGAANVIDFCCIAGPVGFKASFFLPCCQMCVTPFYVISRSFLLVLR